MPVVEIDERATDMCSLSEGIYERGVAKGIAKGVAKGIAKVVLNYMGRTHCELEKALDDLGIAADERAAVLEWVERLTPVTA